MKRLAVSVLTVAATLAVAAPAEAWRQPYGGCDEAHVAPHSEAADECRAHGWIIRPHVIIGPHGHVRWSDR